MRKETERPRGAIDDLIDPHFDPPGSVFDGFCHSSFDEDRHGWLRTQLSAHDNPAVMMAYSIIELHNENNALRKRLYEMAKKADMWRGTTDMFKNDPPLVPPMEDRRSRRVAS